MIKRSTQSLIGIDSSRSDAIEIQQREEFHELAKDVQNLLKQIGQGFTKVEDLVKMENDTTREVIIRETVKSQLVMNAHLTTEVQALGINSETDAKVKGFHGSLKSPEMNQRYNDLMPSREASFKRVFASYKKMTNNDDDEQHKGFQHGSGETIRASNSKTSGIERSWATFIDWLHSNEQLFCIQGKPGSGKSTLVKFIIDNRKTTQLLRRWNADVVVVSYFFWKIGSSPQNSIKGLLCSCLYQLLAVNRNMIERVLDQFPGLASYSSYHDWSVDDLRAVTHYALNNDTRHICFFIDGLDEICNRDGIFKLTHLIEEFLKLPHIKMCVASRPEALVMSWLKNKNNPGILLEDLTRTDMKNFVHKELEPFLAGNNITAKLHERLTSDLVQKAQGIFLWLHLACRSIITGIQNEDPEEMLLARLKTIPSELTALYADMWGRLNQNNPVYRETAARYFHYATQNKNIVPMFPEVGGPSGYPEVIQPTLFQVACAESAAMQKTLFSSAARTSGMEVLRLCDETKVAIQNRCAGLLRVRPRYGRGRMMQILVQANDLDVPHGADGTEGMDDALYSGVDFIHRTAHDFLTDTEFGQSILRFGETPERGWKFRLLKGLLCLLRFLRSEYGVMGRCSSIFHQTIELFESGTDTEQEEAMEMLRIVQRLYDDGVIGDDRPQWQPQAPFFSHLTDHNYFDDFVISSLKRLGSKETATNVLREAWDPDLSLYYNSGRAPSANVIEALISIGADAHAYGLNRGQRMGRMEPFARQGTAFTNLLLSVLKSIDDGKYLDGGSARETLKAALCMAKTCEDLSTTTLVLGGVDGSGKPSMKNLTWLSRPQTFVRERRPWLLYEVDFKFLLLHLFSNLAVSSTADASINSDISELVSRLENPTAILRLIISSDERSDTVACHRVPSQLASSMEISGISEALFPPDDAGVTSKEAQEARELERGNAVRKFTTSLMSNMEVEKVSLESAIVSLASKGLGFCTLQETGIIPTPSFIERLESFGKHYPSTIQRLKLEVGNGRR